MYEMYKNKKLTALSMRYQKNNYNNSNALLLNNIC